jgi:hypothetical protein
MHNEHIYSFENEQAESLISDIELLIEKYCNKDVAKILFGDDNICIDPDIELYSNLQTNKGAKIVQIKYTNL